MAGNFLAASYFCEAAINNRIQIYFECFAVGAENFTFHSVQKSFAKVMKKMTLGVFEIEYPKGAYFLTISTKGMAPSATMAET